MECSFPNCGEVAITIKGGCALCKKHAGMDEIELGRLWLEEQYGGNDERT